MANTLKFGNGDWATKEGSTLAYNNENGNFKPLPFDFTRAGSATKVNKQGLIEVVSNNEPRIDFTDNSKGALLLEPQRTNSITHSNDFSQSIYGKINLTITANEGISPDGTQNANLLVPNAAVGNRYLTNNTGSNLKTNTVFLKKKELRYVTFGNAQSNVLVDLENGTISASSVSTNNFTIENYGNGWYRVSCFNTLDVNLQIQIFLGIDGSGSNIATNGTDGVYIYGFEIQNGSYPTSYIPTNGSAVTRSAETCNGAGDANTFNDSEGVLFADIAANSKGGGYKLISITDSISGNSFISIGMMNNTTELYKQIRFGGLNLFPNFTDKADQTSFNKIAIKYKSGDSSFYVNGFEIDSSSVTYTPSANMSEIKFSYFQDGDDFYGNTKQIQYFDTALNDTDLEELTSWKSFSEMARDLLYTIQ